MADIICEEHVQTVCVQYASEHMLFGEEFAWILPLFLLPVREGWSGTFVTCLI